MIKLFYVPMTRATRPRWLLEELGVPYELVRMTREETKNPDYLRVHPLGKTPALQDGDVTIFESAAIVKYLADKYGRLAPKPGTRERAGYEQWIMFTMATLDPLVTQYALHTRVRPEEKRIHAMADEAKAEFIAAAKPLEDVLEKRQFVLGDDFSAADVVVGGLLAWAAASRLLETLPALTAYVNRLKARPAFVKSRKD